MAINLFLPFVSTTIMAVFVVLVFERYFKRRKLHFLYWGIGLAMFGAGSFAEAFLALHWNRAIFFVWYLFGAALNAAWIGHGTLNLMVRKTWVHVLTGLLVVGSLYAAYLMVKVMPNIDENVFTSAKPISEQFGTKRVDPSQPLAAGIQTKTVEYGGESVTVIPGVLPLGAPVRLTTPFFNIYGLLTLVGGAIWSAYLFLRKRVLPNRVIGNVLIAAGALFIGSASTLTRLGYGQFLYLGELVSAILMFAGFQAAAKPETSPAQLPARQQVATGD
jgi:hypothetical protein